MTWIKAEEIKDLAPGVRIRIGAKTYIRMVDSIAHHVEGCMFDPETGDWIHWSRLVLFDEAVEINPEGD